MVKGKEAWVLKLEGSQFGPFSEIEIETILSSKKLIGTLYACRVGSTSWFILSSIDQIKKKTSATWDHDSIEIEDAAGKRDNVRISMMATVAKKLPTGSQMIGVCADISKGGMQVINSTSTQFKQDEVLILLINPITNEGIEPFSAMAKVAWVKNPVKKVGFKFLDLEANPSLQNYIEKNGQSFG